MDQKTWGWKRKPSKKSLMKQRAFELEKSVEELNEELSNVQAKCNEKDLILEKKTKLAEQAIAGWEKAEAETLCFKEQLNEALNAKQTLEEKISKMEETLKEYTQKLQIAKEEQEKTILDYMRKITLEQDKIRILEQTLNEKNNKIATLGAEITHLLETLKEVHEIRLKLESNLSQSRFKTEQLEKINSNLKYELCMLQKEVEIRSQEREFDHKSANLAQRQNLENVKKITKLETECQRLRVMVRKRLPGPQAVKKMKNEVELLGLGFSNNINNNDIDNNSFMRSSLIERFNAMEEENKNLKETLVRKNNELQLARAINLRKIEEDTKSCIESSSWASVLISEMDNSFKTQKPTSTPTHSCKSPLSELSLMDDFVEMEKLALEDNKGPEKEIIEKGVLRIIGFIEGLIEKSAEEKYTVREFLWESKGFKELLQNFGLVCNDLINGRAKVESFVNEICVVLDWIANHCFSLQDVSEMRETILKDCNGIEVLLNSPCNGRNEKRGLFVKGKEEVENSIENGEGNGDDGNGDDNENVVSNGGENESNSNIIAQKDENNTNVTAMEDPNDINEQVETQECGENVKTLGEELKFIGSPKEVILLDKFENPSFTPTNDIIIPNRDNRISTTTRRNLEAEFNTTKSHDTTQVKDVPKSQLGTLALIPKKQQEGTNLLRKLLMRRKKESFKKLALPIVT